MVGDVLGNILGKKKKVLIDFRSKNRVTKGYCYACHEKSTFKEHPNYGEVCTECGNTADDSPVPEQVLHQLNITPWSERQENKRRR